METPRTFEVVCWLFTFSMVVALLLRNKKVQRRLYNLFHVTSEEEPKRASSEQEFIKFLSDGQLRTAPYIDACDWYVKFIDLKYRAHWRAIQSAVIGAKLGATPDASDVAKVDKILANIAKDLSKKEEYALSDLEDVLINQGLIHDHYSDGRAALHQLMFTLLGWLSRCQKPFLFL
jgi:hypothetical protein